MKLLVGALAAPLVCAFALSGREPSSQPASLADAPQDPASRPASASRSSARPADTVSVEALTAALYDVISGPAGAKRDWDRFRSLFHPGAKMLALRPGPGGTSTALEMTPDDYARRSGPFIERTGFFERSVANRVEEFGDLAHVWSTYEGRKAAEDPTPMMTGVNSIQLIRVGGRWAVLSLSWDEAREGKPLPEKYRAAK
jgi:hypothetical protein